MVREWMTNNLPGFFSTNKTNQPLLDMLLLEKLDPTINPITYDNINQMSLERAYEAIGLDIFEFESITSNSLPKFLLSESRPALLKENEDIPLWTLWGNQREIINALVSDQYFKMISNGDKDYSHSLARYVNETFQSNFILLSISSFLNVIEREFSLSRDNANAEYLKFRPKSLSRLRNRLFTISLNIHSIRDDVFIFWDYIKKTNRLLSFNLRPSKYIIRNSSAQESPKAHDF